MRCQWGGLDVADTGVGGGEKGSATPAEDADRTETGQISSRAASTPSSSQSAALH